LDNEVKIILTTRARVR